MRNRLHKQGVGLEITPAAKQYLLEHGYDSKNGVRPLRRLIQDTIEDHVALELLDEKLSKGHILQVATKQGELEYVAATE